MMATSSKVSRNARTLAHICRSKPRKRGGALKYKSVQSWLIFCVSRESSIMLVICVCVK